MSQPAIRVENLSKQYRIGAADQSYRTFREAVTDAVAAPFRRLRSLGRKPPEADTIWALKDVSFSVEPGEVVGIVGRNGAGKSTLLKILSRITDPTSGYAQTRGRVASLLEVGTGFHAELTGRENIYLNGAILGMTRREIQRNFDDIVSFAEVEKFIDTPVKRFSSGMYLRLAFAVAAHLQPEVLLVDEVLAVGDAAFQKKCLGKMGDVARQGRTVLFVSHNLAAVRVLCPSSIYIDRGSIQSKGPTAEVLERYGNSGGELTSRCWTRPKTVGAPSPEPPVKIVAVRLVEPEDGPAAADRVVRIAVDFAVDGKPSHVIPGIHVLNSEGLILFSAADWGLDLLAPGLYTSTCEIPEYLLNEGRISMSAFLFNSDRPTAIEVPVDFVSQAISFDVDNDAWVDRTRGKWLRPWPGFVRPDLRWTTDKSSGEKSQAV